MSSITTTPPPPPGVWEKYAPSLGQAWSFTMHIGSASAGAVGGASAVLLTLHAATPDQAKMLVDSWNGMINNANGFIMSASAFFVTATAIYAGVRRSAGALISAAREVPGVEGIAIDPGATGPAAAAAEDRTMPNVVRGIVVPVVAPPPPVVPLGKEVS